jgi:hypothetical protein
MTLVTRLLPTTPPLHHDAWPMDDTATQRTWRVTSTQALGHGPVCRFPTRRLHRRDVRPVADLPWGPGRVALPRHVRKCFCATGRGTRHLLTARRSARGAPWARRPQRRAHWLVHSAVARAGTAGARLSRARGVAVRPYG